MKARIITTAGVAAAAMLITAGAASARALPVAPVAAPRSATSLTLITNDPDSGHGTPAVWAEDTIWRSVTVTRGAQVTGDHCGLAVSAGCWPYTADLADFGTFETVKGAGTPNQACTGCAGEKIRRKVPGSMQGTYKVTFYASSATPDASRVPFTHNDHGAAASAPFTSTSWGELFFPAGTSFGGLTGGAYEWDYTAITFPVQRWVDSSSVSNNDGNSLHAGNITG